MTFTEIREWFQFIFVMVGGAIAASAYFQNQRQRRLENALKMLTLYKDSLRENDFTTWREIFIGTCEAASPPKGCFISSYGKIVPLSTMWSEGSEDDDAIQRMAANFEMICYQILSKTIEARIVWFELGQLMFHMHKWLSDVKGHNENKTLLEENYPSLMRFFKKYDTNIKKWPCRIHAQYE